MKLEELLRRWSQLEPALCEFSEGDQDGESWYTITLNHGKAFVEYKKTTQEDHAILQAVVQKIIENKGWLWSILYSSKGVYRAGVKIAERYVSQTARYPAYALLAAYLKALEMDTVKEEK